MRYPANMDKAARAAEERGCTVIRGAANLLILDYDRAEDVERLLGQYRKMVDENFGIISEERWESKTPGHWHVVLVLNADLPAAERIALQAALGSDPAREILAVARLGDHPEPSMLFRPGRR